MDIAIILSHCRDYVKCAAHCGGGTHRKLKMLSQVNCRIDFCAGECYHY